MGFFGFGQKDIIEQMARALRAAYLAMIKAQDSAWG